MHFRMKCFAPVGKEKNNIEFCHNRLHQYQVFLTQNVKQAPKIYPILGGCQILKFREASEGT